MPYPAVRPRPYRPYRGVPPGLVCALKIKIKTPATQATRNYHPEIEGRALIGSFNKIALLVAIG